jgi:hypothetical protein
MPNFPYLLLKFMIDMLLVLFYNIEQLYYYIEQEKTNVDTNRKKKDFTIIFKGSF